MRSSFISCGNFIYSLHVIFSDSVSFLLLQVVETILLTMEVDEIEEIISPADIQKLLL